MTLRWILLCLLLTSCAHYEHISYLDAGEYLLPEGSNIYVVGNVDQQLKDRARDTLNQSHWPVAKAAPDLELKFTKSERPRAKLYSNHLKKSIKMENAYYLQISELGMESSTSGSITKSEGSDDNYQASAKTVVSALISLIDPQKNIIFADKSQTAKGEGHESGPLPKAPGKSSLRPLVYGLVGQKLPRELAQDQLKTLAESGANQNAISNFNQSLAQMLAPHKKVVRMNFDKDAPEYSEFRDLYKEQKFQEAIALNQRLAKDENYWRALRNNAILFEKMGDYFNAKQDWEQSLANCPQNERDCLTLKEKYEMFIQREKAQLLINTNSIKKVSKL